MRKLATVLAGFITAACILGAGPAPAPSHHHNPPPISTNGKDWTAPNGVGR